jgi:hypothetical protein
MEKEIWIILVILLFTVSTTNKINNTMLGLLTVTHSRGGNFDIIKRYLNQYTQECYINMISEINLVWNDKTIPLEVLDYSTKTNIPVYFYFTQNNSMNNRYALSSSSKA